MGSLAESLVVYEIDDVIPSSGDEEAVAKFEKEFTKRSALRRSTRKRKLCTKSSNGGSSSKQVGSISADETTQIYKPSSQEMKPRKKHTKKEVEDKNQNESMQEISGKIGKKEVESENIEKEKREVEKIEIEKEEGDHIAKENDESGNIEKEKGEVGKIEIEKEEGDNIDTEKYDEENIDTEKYDEENIDTEKELGEILKPKKKTVNVL